MPWSQYCAEQPIDRQVDVVDGIETWTGGCETESGLQIDGQIQMVSQKWLTANNFSISENGKVLITIDGGLENHIVGDLLQMDFTGEICGVHADDCGNGLIQLELNATIYPLSDYPGDYETSVHGFINGESPIGFEGSWSKEDASCSIEATDGVFGIWQDVRQDLVLNGTENCDGCAEWRIQGSKEAEYCGDLP